MAATSAQQKRRERETTIAGAKRNASKLQSAQIVMQLMNYQLPGPENRPDWMGAQGAWQIGYGMSSKYATIMDAI